MRHLLLAGILVALPLTQPVILKGQSEPPDFPVALEGFGILDPPYFVGEGAGVDQVQACEESLSQTDSSLCAAVYQAVLVDQAVVIMAWGMHETQAFQVKICKVKSSEEVSLLEFRHSLGGHPKGDSKFFLKLFLLRQGDHAFISPKVLRIRDSIGEHRIQVKEAPKHPGKDLKPR